MKSIRKCGLLLHLTSLPSPFGIGDLGPAAHDFIDFLSRSKQSGWQFLATGPTNAGLGNSPYMSLSAFAGNPLLISPDLLQKNGYIFREFLQETPKFSEFQVDFESVILHKERIFANAFQIFRKKNQGDDFIAFCNSAQYWLEDYALFMSLGEAFSCKPWYEWPRAIATRTTEALAEWRQRLSERILYHKFIQYCFFDQWRQLHACAESKGIQLIGDLPFYVGLDSADVWANQDIFRLDQKTLRPTHVAGVPPDYFSATGQRWGNPVYRWELEDNRPNRPLYSWWQRRLQHLLDMVDMVRIDHFRGFEASWQIPAVEETAINGRWIKGPGTAFFTEMQEKIGKMPIIAEDLGVITPAVEKILFELGFPGMKILQFAFDSDETNPYLPHNYTSTHCVVYTGTHDNSTSLGWFLDPAVAEEAKIRARHYVNYHDNGQFHWDLIRLALSSIAELAIIPLQDILGFGDDCRMNIPGTCDNNWRWRCAAGFLNDESSKRLADETVFYHRYTATGPAETFA
jgi:4-alpha-glucanotransferase